MDNFDLKKYLAEGRLHKEVEKVNEMFQTYDEMFKHFYDKAIDQGMTPEEAEKDAKENMRLFTQAMDEGKLTNEGILNEESRPEPGTAYDFDQESMKQFEKFIQDNIETYIENLEKSTRWFLFKAGEGRSPDVFNNTLKALNNLNSRMKSSDYGPYNFSDYELSKRKSK